MLGLLANGAPPPYPTPDAPAVEWIVWGGCMGTAALLGGWVLFNLNCSKRVRDTLAGVALLGAIVLVGFATLFVMQRSWDREQERFRRMEHERIERLERDAQERSQP
jgi:hypothetical protein